MSIYFRDTQTAFQLRSNGDLRQGRRLLSLLRYKGLIRISKYLLPILLRIPLVKYGVKKQIFDHFCGGETLSATEKVTNRLQSIGVNSMLVYSIEGEHDEHTFAHVYEEQKKLITHASRYPHMPQIALKCTGICRLTLLEKIQRGDTLTGAEKDEYALFLSRVKEICSLGVERGITTLIDAEETWIQDVLDEIASEMMETFNQEKPNVYNTIQFYRKDGMDLLTKAYERATRKGYILGVKAVRGAYIEKETLRATQMNYPNPLNDTKADSDRLFDQGLDFFINHIDHMAMYVGTHNEKSCAHLIETMKAKGIPLDHPHLTFGQLYGMADHISFNITKLGGLVSKYIPYGKVQEVMPYLIRRIDENSSVSEGSEIEKQLLSAEIKRRATVA